MSQYDSVELNPLLVELLGSYNERLSYVKADEEKIQSVAEQMVKERPDFFEKTESQFIEIMCKLQGVPPEGLAKIELLVFRAGKKILAEQKK